MVEAQPVNNVNNRPKVAETGKVAIAHGSVEFCEATPIALADKP